MSERVVASVRTLEAIRLISGGADHVRDRLDTWSRELGLAAPAGRYVADALRDGQVRKTLERYSDGRLVIVDVWRDDGDDVVRRGGVPTPPGRPNGDGERASGPPPGEGAGGTKTTTTETATANGGR